MPWRRDSLPTPAFLGSPGGSAGEESTCNAGDTSSIPGLGRSPGEGNGCPLQYSGLEPGVHGRLRGREGRVRGQRGGEERESSFTETGSLVVMSLTPLCLSLSLSLSASLPLYFCLPDSLSASPSLPLSLCLPDSLCLTYLCHPLSLSPSSNMTAAGKSVRFCFLGSQEGFSSN